MIQIPSRLQTEITPDQPDLNTILALVNERLEKAIREGRQVTDFGLPYATQFPGGGQLW